MEIWQQHHSLPADHAEAGVRQGIDWLALEADVRGHPDRHRNPAQQAGSAGGWKCGQKAGGENESAHKMNTQSYKATLKKSADECVGIGNFIYNDERDTIYIVLPHISGKPAVLPSGKVALDAIRISREKTDKQRVW